MLAPTPNLPIAYLGITQWEYDGLIKVMKMLRDGSIKHYRDVTQPPIGKYFNMGCAGMSNGCGTVACIGGWVWILSGRSVEDAFSSYVVSASQPMGLHQLYYPKGRAWSQITPDEAADAIQEYLRTGKPTWYKELYV